MKFRKQKQEEKEMYVYFKLLNNKNAVEMTWT